ncbi:MAG: spore coat associated protein CotJA [Bacillota bacterium]|nr:spore coat associated protein CotJA [Bacillota bacterium]
MNIIMDMLNAPDMQDIDNMPIGMAYVPWQKWQKVYNDEVALSRGTIFQELDLPFIGEGAD